MPDLPMTGERIVPIKMAYDVRELQAHVARYLWALEFCAGRSVLDAACGSGYGSEILSWGADHVHGIDIDMPTVVYAWEHYKTPKNGFQQMSVYDIRQINAIFEVVVSFETIEHLQDPSRFIDAVWEEMLPGGLFICSAPENSGSKHHVRDYGKSELKALLSQYFDPQLMRYFSQGPRMEIKEQDAPLWPDHPVHIFVCKK